MLLPVLASWLCFGMGLSNALNVHVQSLWAESPLALQILESASDIDEALYHSAVQYIAGASNADDDDVKEEDDEEYSNSLLFKRVSSGLDPAKAALLNFSVVYSKFSPRIQAHYDFYENNVEPVYIDRIQRQCRTDSFGTPVLTKENPTPQAWLLYNDKLYCSPDEIFALQTDKSQKDNHHVDLQPFDRVIGHNKDAPLLVLYGDVTLDFFIRMLTNLYTSAQSGKLRFVWRYIKKSPAAAAKKNQLYGYGVDLTFKRTDYLAIDDRGKNTKKKGRIPSLESGIRLSAEDSALLSSKLISKVVGSQSYEELLLLLEDFPNQIPNISSGKVSAKVAANVDANKKLGLTKDSIGLYVNGAPINKLELDVFKLVEKVLQEYELVSRMESFGFNIEQSKLLISKFALLTAVKQAQFYQGNTKMGKNENRFKIYQHEYTPQFDGETVRSGSGGLVYFNNLELDDNYLQFTSNRLEAYTGDSIHQLKQGQIPILRENVHDLVFAIDITDKEQLTLFFQLAKLILDRSLPQQLGLIPMPNKDNKFSQPLIERFYFVANSNPKESLALIYKYLESKSDEEVEGMIAAIDIPEDYEFIPVNTATLDVFAIEQPSIILNGVISDLASSNWQMALGRQIRQDVQLIQHYLNNNVLRNYVPLKSILYENARSKRNLKVIPTDFSTLKYKLVDEELIRASTLISTSVQGKQYPRNLWLIGDFGKPKIKSQFAEILRLMKQSKHSNTQLRIINYGSVTPLYLKDEKKLGSLRSTDLDALLKQVAVDKEIDTSKGYNLEVLELLGRGKLPLSHSFLLLNSRYIRLDSVLSTDELEELIEFESNQRLLIMEDLFESYDEKFKGKNLREFHAGNSIKYADWYDLVSSTVAKSFFLDETLYVADVGRYDFNLLNDGNSFYVQKTNVPQMVDILLIIDPMDEFSQQAVSILQSITDFPFVSVKILLQPELLVQLKGDDKSLEGGINRFYHGVFPRSTVKFNSKDELQVDVKKSVDDTPFNVLFTASLEAPLNWMVALENVTPSLVDMDNFQISKEDTEVTTAVFELKLLLVEGFAREIKSGMVPGRLVVEMSPSLDDDFVSKDTTVMSTLGYFQLQAKPGVWKFKIKPETASSLHYSLLSANENAYDSNTNPLKYSNISIFDLGAHTTRLRVAKNSGYEDKSFICEDVVTSAKSGSKADINIFVIVSGHLYERFLSIMTASVRKHSKSTIKFWIIENYISPNFKKLIPYLANKYDFEYEFITYKWPQWLRQQREKQRSIWGYKILFLDVLFPQDLEKVIFVDADQIVRTDMKELVNVDLEGKVYGFTPMGDSREEMEGYRFWKQGYWAELLGDDLKYHISALYVVDLDAFRKQNAGDVLRSSYQKLSSDPLSLSNLDQDLPNNIQKRLPIHSLDEDWLWCETWCSDDKLKSAKTIDLCNNPLTKEPKLERAKRQIPEWKVYDNEVSDLIMQMQQDEVVASQSEAQQANELEESTEEEGEGGVASGDDENDDYDIFDEL